MRTEEIDTITEPERTVGGPTSETLYAELGAITREAGNRKSDVLPAFTLTDGARDLTAGGTKDAKPGDAEKTWMASLKPSEIEAATKALKEVGIKATSPAEIAAECKKLVGALASDEYETRERAKAALQKIGSAALPALLGGMGSEDAHVRKECGRLADSMLRPAQRIVDAHGQLRDLEHQDKHLLSQDDPKGVEEKRLALHSKLKDLPLEMSKNEADSLKRIKDLVTAMERECGARKTGATEHEQASFKKIKERIADQEDSAKALKAGAGDFLARTAGLMADPVINPNGIDFKELGSTIKKALAAGAEAQNEHIQAAMAKFMAMGGKNPPADVIAAFKKAGGNLDSLPPPNALDDLKN